MTGPAVDTGEPDGAEAVRRRVRPAGFSADARLAGAPVLAASAASTPLPGRRRVGRPAAPSGRPLRRWSPARRGSPASSGRRLGIGRGQDTGYGSPAFLRACRIVAAYGEIADREPPALLALWRRLRAGSLVLMWYRLSLPSIRIRLTSSPSGRMIGEHFAIRERGRRRFRRAQGVLPLPAEFSLYMRGRRRQAVRTNVGHARSAGLTIESCTVDDWSPGAGDFRASSVTPGPVEKWMVRDRDGAVVADSILSVDEDVALLHGLVSSGPHARWLLHTAIVERLCGCCSVLLTNSPDAYLVGKGNQHFQRLLGYEIMRLRLRP